MQNQFPAVYRGSVKGGGMSKLERWVAFPRFVVMALSMVSMAVHKYCCYFGIMPSRRNATFKNRK